MSEYEPYWYYIFIFFGLILVFGILIFIAHQATNKKK